MQIPSEVARAEAFAALVSQLAMTQGVHEIRFRTSRGRVTSARSGKNGRAPLLVMAEHLPQQSTAVQQWVAAHEMSHIILHRGLPKVLYLILPGLAVSGGGYTIVGAELIGQTPARTVILIASYLLLCGCAITGSAIWLRSRRREEDEADDQAAAWGYPVSAEIRDYLEAIARRPRTQRKLMDTHRAPIERYQRHQLRAAAGPKS